MIRREIKQKNPYKMICIRVPEKQGGYSYHRMIAGLARRLIAEDSRVTYTSKSRWKKFARKGE